MPLGTEVELGPGDIVLDGDPPPPFRGGYQLWGRAYAFSSVTRKIFLACYHVIETTVSIQPNFAQ